MRLLIVAVGRTKDGPERVLVKRYIERVSKGGKALGLTGCDVIEIAESRASSTDRRRHEEADAIRARIPDGARVVVFDERGQSETSNAFAARMREARDASAPAMACVIGGPDGLDASLRQGARVLSFGALTLPHQMVRALVAEQLYRATTILAGHPYHRE